MRLDTVESRTRRKCNENKSKEKVKQMDWLENVKTKQEVYYLWSTWHLLLDVYE